MGLFSYLIVFTSDRNFEKREIDFLGITMMNSLVASGSMIGIRMRFGYFLLFSFVILDTKQGRELLLMSAVKSSLSFCVMILE